MPISEKYYGLLHIPSGQWMIDLGRGRGYTSIEFPLLSHQIGLPPRLFITKRGASQARLWWLKGVTKVVMHQVGGDWDVEYDEDWQTTPRPDRKPEDMEVVEILVEVKRFGQHT